MSLLSVVSVCFNIIVRLQVFQSLPIKMLLESKTCTAPEFKTLGRQFTHFYVNIYFNFNNTTRLYITLYAGVELYII
jgi:hypothetical protein